MIGHQKLNYVEYCQFKTIKLLGFDQKSQFKKNNYSDFLFVNGINCKT